MALAVVAAGSLAGVTKPAIAAETPVSGAATKTFQSPFTSTFSLSGSAVTATPESTLGAIGQPSSSLYTPALPTTTNGYLLETSIAGCQNATPTATRCTNRGTLTVTFSAPVTNPVIHVAGIGAVTSINNKPAYGYDIEFQLTGAAPSGATLQRVSGTGNLAVANGDRIYNSVTNGETTCSANAGCGSVRVVGTVTQVTFQINIWIQSLDSKTYDSTSFSSTAADAVAITWSVDQDFGDAPGTFDAPLAASHVVGALRLGTGITADATNVIAPTASPLASATANADSDNLTWPTLRSNEVVNLTVPITGTASAGGTVCNWIDFDNDGVYSGVEGTCSAFAAGASSAVITVSVPRNAVPGQRLTRLRASHGNVLTTATPTGRAPSGEVEDALVAIDSVPVAANDTAATNEDTAVIGDAAANDTLSADGGNAWSLVGANGGAANGTVTMTTAGAFTYTPNPNFNGSDSFTYRITDADGDTSDATVSVTVNPVDDLPVATNDTAATNEDTAVTGNAAANDTPSGDGGNVWSLVGANGGAANGTVTMTTAGAFTYTPNPNFNGSDTFTYRITDADGDTSDATVSVTVNPVDDLPVAANDTAATNEDTAVTGNAAANDTPSGDGGNVWSLVGSNGGAANGTVTMTTAGAFTYTPNANWSGSDSFTYQLADADGDVSTASVAVTVSAVDDLPVATNDTVTTDEGVAVSGNAAANDTPSGDGGNVWSLVGANGGAANGTVTMTTAGAFTYTPNANWSGSDSFTYQLADANGSVSTATVSVSVNPVDDVPVATNDTAATNEDTAVTGDAAANDTPSADGGNVWSLVGSNGGAANGTVTMTTAGAFTYTPNANWSGSDSFTYRITDADGDTSDATVSVMVNPVDDVPVASNDTASTMEDTAVIGDAAANDTPSGDGGNVWSLVGANGGAANGAVTMTAAGVFTYTPTSTSAAATASPIGWPTWTGTCPPRRSRSRSARSATRRKPSTTAPRLQRMSRCPAMCQRTTRRRATAATSGA